MQRSLSHWGLHSFSTHSLPNLVCGNNRCAAPIILGTYRTKPQQTEEHVPLTLLNSLLLMLLHIYKCWPVWLTSPFLCFLHDSCSVTLTIYCFLSTPAPNHSHTSSPLTFNIKNSNAASIRLTIGSLYFLFVKLSNVHLMFPLTLLLELERRAKFSGNYFIISLSYQTFRMSVQTCLRPLQLCLSILPQFFVSYAVLCLASGLQAFSEPKALLFCVASSVIQSQTYPRF